MWANFQWGWLLNDDARICTHPSSTGHWKRQKHDLKYRCMAPPCLAPIVDLMVTPFTIQVPRLLPGQASGEGERPSESSSQNRSKIDEVAVAKATAANWRLQRGVPHSRNHFWVRHTPYETTVELKNPFSSVSSQQWWWHWGARWWCGSYFGAAAVLEERACAKRREDRTLAARISGIWARRPDNQLKGWNSSEGIPRWLIKAHTDERGDDRGSCLPTGTAGKGEGLRREVAPSSLEHRWRSLPGWGCYQRPVVKGKRQKASSLSPSPCPGALSTMK